MFRRTATLPFCGAWRQVTAFSLKPQADPNDCVIYCSDGQSTALFASEYYRRHRTDSLWFVGVDCSVSHRNAEYVIGRDDERFHAHESFFKTDVLSWVQDTLGIKHRRERSGVFGYSCGGAFAASMGIRHPDLYQSIFAFSIAGRPVTRWDHEPESSLKHSSFFLRSGSREPRGMRHYMTRLGKWLIQSGAQVDHLVESGGHEFALWSMALNGAISRAIN